VSDGQSFGVVQTTQARPWHGKAVTLTRDPKGRPFLCAKAPIAASGRLGASDRPNATTTLRNLNTGGMAYKPDAHHGLDAPPILGDVKVLQRDR
jgi:hypothetical protein